jgi:D-alanyl-D-alanine carboxypeptidase
MKRWIVTACLAWFATAAMATDLQQAFDAQLKANALGHGIPAQAVLVMHNSEVLYKGATGATSETPFPIFSVSKLFTNTLVLQLAEQGKIDLNAPASRYVPTLPAAWKDIRVEKFMNHVSGLPEFWNPKEPGLPFPATLDDAFRKVAAMPPWSAPDVQTRYAGTNYLVLEAVLQNVTHMRYRDLVMARIIKPLGLRHTSLQPSMPPVGMVGSYHAQDGSVVVDPPIAWPDYAIAQGCIVSTLDDVATFMAAVADGKLVSKARLVKAWHPYRFPNGNDGGFASGWDYGQSGDWHEMGHDGGTKVRVRIVYRENLDDHYVIVYLTNGNRDDVWSRTLVDSIQQFVVVPR